MIGLGGLSSSSLRWLVASLLLLLSFSSLLFLSAARSTHGRRGRIVELSHQQSQQQRKESHDQSHDSLPSHGGVFLNEQFVSALLDVRIDLVGQSPGPAAGLSHVVLTHHDHVMVGDLFPRRKPIQPIQRLQLVQPFLILFFLLMLLLLLLGVSQHKGVGIVIAIIVGS